MARIQSPRKARSKSKKGNRAMRAVSSPPCDGKATVSALQLVDQVQAMLDLICFLSRYGDTSFTRRQYRRLVAATPARAKTLSPGTVTRLQDLRLRHLAQIAGFYTITSLQLRLNSDAQCLIPTDRVVQEVVDWARSFGITLPNNEAERPRSPEFIRELDELF
jgi:hypothetical protein